jgi:two-component system NtrC family sensor kinase
MYRTQRPYQPDHIRAGGINYSPVGVYLMNYHTRPGSDTGHSRPTVASLLVSLRVRVTLMVAIVVTAVVGTASYLEQRVFEANIATNLLVTAQSTALAVADDIEVSRDPVERDDLTESLHEFSGAFPSIRNISVVIVQNGQAVLLRSTSSAEIGEALPLARRVVAANAMLTEPARSHLRLVGAPVVRDDQVWGVVVVSYSMAWVDQLRLQGGIVLLWFVPLAVALVTLSVDQLTRRLVHKPIAGIHETMQRVRARDLGARAPVIRPDEIGAVAMGLNDMLIEMEGFSVALQDRVREATTELQETNDQLVESYQRVFALREALARADQMVAVGHMAASVAHQVGTPLNLISGYVQMIREEEGCDSRVTRRLAIVQEQIAKVTSIVRTMLDHARRPTPRERTNVADLVRRVCEVARPKLETQGVRLELVVAETPTIMADAVQLELALLNLVTNGLDAMSSGGVMSLGVATTPDGHVSVTVSDTGTGIAPELLPHIFEPWVTTKEAGHGTGLGLSITREVIAAHGGTITVHSEVDRGSAFFVELPVAPPDPEAWCPPVDGSPRSET